MEKIENKKIFAGFFISLLFCVSISIAYLTSERDTRAVEESDSYQLEEVVNSWLYKVFIPYIDKTKKPKIANFLFFGDLMIDRYVGTLVKKKKNGVHYLVGKITEEEKDFFEGYDVVSANLEGAITDNGDHYSPGYKHDFAFIPEKIKVFKDYNFNFFNLANNHFSDQGVKGIKETRKHLTNMGILHSGCRDGDTGDCSYIITQVGGLKVAMVGFSMVYKTPPEEDMIKVIEKAKKESDKIIINVHWGYEYANRQSKKQKNLAHKFIDAGADVIIGHHPHVVQGMEFYKGKAIFYSLGNFIFDQYFSTNAQQGLAIQVYLLANSERFTIHPLKSKQSQVSLMNDKEKTAFFKKFFSWSNLSEEEKGRLDL